mmetsp:Transcript_11782/g.26188  ORF Transcript_11782/g.26188 Transcript_11782/m.26188 type:complete len:646 (+) Transcript_11782:332-2269(+)
MSERNNDVVAKEDDGGNIQAGRSQESGCASPVPVIVIPGKRRRGGAQTKRVAINEDRNTSDVISVQSDSIKLSVISGLDSTGYSELDSKFESKLVPQLVKMLDHGCAWIEGSWIDMNIFAIKSSEPQYERVLFSSENNNTIIEERSHDSDNSDDGFLSPEMATISSSNLNIVETPQPSRRALVESANVDPQTAPENTGGEDEGHERTVDGPNSDVDVRREGIRTIPSPRTHGSDIDVRKPSSAHDQDEPLLSHKTSSWNSYEEEQLNTLAEQTELKLVHSHTSQAELERPEGGREQPICLDDPDPLITHGKANPSIPHRERELIDGENKIPTYVTDKDEYALVVDDYLFDDGDDSMAVVLSDEEVGSREENQDRVDEDCEKREPSLVSNKKQGADYCWIREESVHAIASAKNREHLEPAPLLRMNERANSKDGPEMVRQEGRTIEDSWTHSKDEWCERYGGPQRGHTNSEDIHIMKPSKSMGDPPHRSSLEVPLRTSSDHSKSFGARFPRDPSPCRRHIRDDCTPRWLEPDGIRDDPMESRGSKKTAADPEASAIEVIDLVGCVGKSVEPWSSKSPREFDSEGRTYGRHTSKPSPEDMHCACKTLVNERDAALEVANRLRSRATLLKRKRMMRDKRKKDRCIIAM